MDVAQNFLNQKLTSIASGISVIVRCVTIIYAKFMQFEFPRIKYHNLLLKIMHIISRIHANSNRELTAMENLC